ncbi:MAG: hypothetical protein AAGA56_22805, partial [Myxococcota bacterium]
RVGENALTTGSSQDRDGTYSAWMRHLNRGRPDLTADRLEHRRPCTRKKTKKPARPSYEERPALRL